MLLPLLAALVCLVVPGLPVLMYRLLPRRLPPPSGAVDLARQEAVPTGGDTPEEVSPPTTITRQGGAPKGRGGPAGEDRRRADPDRGQSHRRASSTKAPLPRLNLGSYSWLNFLFAPALVLTFLALTLGWATLLHYIAERHAQAFPAGVHLFKLSPNGLIFALPGPFLGILSVAPLLLFLARLLLGRERFVEYLYWEAGRLEAQGGCSLDGMILLLSGLCLLIGVLSAASVFLAMNWYVCLTDEAIVINPFFGLQEEVRGYDTVREIVVTTHRKADRDVIEGPDIGIRFADGTSWSTGHTFRLPQDPEHVTALVSFLVRKTGKPITRARLLEDVGGW